MGFINSIKFRINKKLIKSYWKKNNTHNFTHLGVVSNEGFIEFVKKGGIQVGKKTYGQLNVHYSGNPNERLIIGNYCSISGSSHFLLGGEHNYRTISTYPFSSRILHQNTEVNSKGPIIVDDDVWFGDDCWVMSGVKIGKGAIIATGAIVTHDVSPYAIVAGCPAKVIKYRFSSTIRQKLNTIDISDIEADDGNIDFLHTELTEENIDSVLKGIGLKNECK